MASLKQGTIKKTEHRPPLLGGVDCVEVTGRPTPREGSMESSDPILVANCEYKNCEERAKQNWANKAKLKSQRGQAISSYLFAPLLQLAFSG